MRKQTTKPAAGSSRGRTAQPVRKSQPEIEEDELEKALQQLEESVLSKGGGDPDLEDADPEGGFSTEGSPLSDDSPRGRGGDPVGKAMSATDMSDDEDEEGSPEGDDEDESDESSPMGKSFDQRLQGNGTIRKAMNVAPALQQIAEEFGIHAGDLAKAVNDHIDTRMAERRDYEIRLAKALAVTGRTQARIEEKLDLILKSRGHVPRPKGVLGPHHIIEPDRSVNKGFQAEDGGGGRGNPAQGLPQGITRQHVKDFFKALTLRQVEMQEEAISKGGNHKIDPGFGLMVSDLESRNWEWTAIPPEYRKAIVNDFRKGYSA